MAKGLTPCLNPEVHGVSNHQVGSVAEAECRSLANGTRRSRSLSEAPPSSVKEGDDEEDSISGSMTLDFLDEAAEDEHLHERLAVVLSANPVKVSGFLSTTTRFLRRGDQPDPDSSYGSLLQSFVSNKEVVRTISEHYEEDEAEVQGILDRVHKALTPTDEHGLTPEQHRQINEDIRRYNELQAQIEALVEEQDAIKERYRGTDGEVLAGAGFLEFEDGAIQVTPKTVFDASLAERNLTPEEIEKITITIPEERRIDPTVARRTLSPDRLALALKKGTTAVSISPRN